MSKDDQQMAPWGPPSINDNDWLYNYWASRIQAETVEKDPLKDALNYQPVKDMIVSEMKIFKEKIAEQIWERGRADNDLKTHYAALRDLLKRMELENLL
jgi:hypothetical protein